jgi:hypothetical protein
MIITARTFLTFLIPALVAISCSSVDSTQPAPYAAFHGGCEAIVDTVVIFTNESLSADRYEWDFGNGTTSTAKHPTAVYHQAGEYTVRMICRNASGDADTTVEEIHIVPAISGWKELDVTYVEPFIDGWSWPAISEMLLQYFGRSVRQCTIMDYYYQRDCCNNPEFCTAGVTEQELNTNLRVFGNMEGVWQYAPLSFEQLRMEIAQDRPVVALLQEGGYRYIVLITAWYEWGDIGIISPYNGARVIQYEELVRYGQYNWVQSLYCIKERKGG